MNKSECKCYKYHKIYICIWEEKYNYKKGFNKEDFRKKECKSCAFHFKLVLYLSKVAVVWAYALAEMKP